MSPVTQRIEEVFLEREMVNPGNITGKWWKKGNDDLAVEVISFLEWFQKRGIEIRLQGNFKKSDFKKSD